MAAGWVGGRGFKAEDSATVSQGTRRVRRVRAGDFREAHPHLGKERRWDNRASWPPFPLDALSPWTCPRASKLLAD